MAVITLKAPAKINFSLDITGVQDNGLHTVKTIMQTVSLFDIVKISINPVRNGIRAISVKCNIPGIPENVSNTAYKAAESFLKEVEKKDPGTSAVFAGNIYGGNPNIEIHIQKNIPAESGLAGGSADAAAVLIGLNAVYGCPFTENELCVIGYEIGADIPFAIRGGTMLAGGTGEELSPLQSPGNLYIVLVKPKTNISTKQAYEDYDSFDGIITCRPDTEQLKLFLKKGDFKNFSDGLCNVFENVVKIPEIPDIKSSMKAHGCLGSSMSGSGSAVFGIFENEITALDCFRSLSETKKSIVEKVYLCKPCSHGAIITETENV